MSKAVIIPGGGRDIGGMKEEITLSPTKKESSIGLLSRLLRLDALGKKASVPSSPTSTEPPTTYYGVYIPCEVKKGPDEEAIHVYKNKSEALELVKRYKLSRFKVFQNHQDAVSFALRGAEPIDTTDGNDNSLMGEKPYPFKAPSPQDMVALRKAIEKGLADTVRDRVWDNPRFLVSSGNTPAILQEGSRYNALHIAAKAMNAELCNLILTTVGNPAFVQRLYGSDADSEACEGYEFYLGKSAAEKLVGRLTMFMALVSQKNIRYAFGSNVLVLEISTFRTNRPETKVDNEELKAFEFAAILVDRYLNTPDKAMNETPLHFAAKFGGAETVDVLTSFPQCNKSAVNKYGEEPKDVICKRADNVTGEIAKRISSMLRERYYVPVLHSEDESVMPTIGLPFTPASPPEINTDPLSPRYEIRAFAGPMESNDAEMFRRKWKTPPRQPRPASFRLADITKGFERVGRNLAEQMQVGWKEYWPFLDTFTDLRSPEGLKLLENYLKAKYESACSFAYNESLAQTCNSPDELSFSRISLNISQHSQNADGIMSPITELCVAMKTCKITDRPAHWSKTDPIRQRLCRQPSAKVPNGDISPPINHTVSQLLCIERTCQVFAKRIADALTFSLTAEPEVAGESLKSEAKHLQHTIYTYMDDERFHKIDFALTHSRLAQLVVYKLKQQTTDLDDINNLIEFLLKLRCPNDDIFSSDDERKSFRGMDEEKKCFKSKKITHVIDGHVRCLSSFICDELSDSDVAKGPAVSDNECSEIWEKASKCRCDWKIDAFERNSKKNASFRKNRSILSTSPKSESFIRRLNFDHDIGDGKQHNNFEKPLSVNSPAGDSGATVFTLDMKKCQVIEAEISEDESEASCQSDDEFQTASEHSESDAEDMEEASDRAIAEPFIYGEEPSKMDRLVFDAISDIQLCQLQFPNVYRWRHTVALYTPEERIKWVSESINPDDSVSCTSWNVSVLRTPRADMRRVASPLSRCSTPNKNNNGEDRNVPLQISNWLRITGSNSPRSSLASKSMNHNVSLGY